jgi:RNA polymerase sigma-70 factor (ECF subfamily)
MHDAEIINGLTNNYKHRSYFEKELYVQYEYFIKQGSSKYKLTYEDSFSAYSDAVLAAIQTIINNKFDSNYSLKAYLSQIFRNKCVDLIRKITNTKQKIHKSPVAPELLSHLPETAKNVISMLIDKEKIAHVSHYLDTIGKKCKEILLLSVDGYTDMQIADKLGYHNADVTKSTRLRCREKLNKLINATYE